MYFFEKMSPGERPLCTWFGDIRLIGMYFLVDSSNIYSVRLALWLTINDNITIELLLLVKLTCILLCTLPNITEIYFLVRIVGITPNPLSFSIRITAVVMCPNIGMLGRGNTTLNPGFALNPTLGLASSPKVFFSNASYAVIIFTTKVLKRK